MHRSMQSLHQTIEPIELHVPAAPIQAVSGQDTKAWELGRQAYLNWAVGKLTSGTQVGGGSNEEIIERVETTMGESGGNEGIDRLYQAL